MMDWQDISTAPKDGTRIRVKGDGDERIVVWYDMSDSYSPEGGAWATEGPVSYSNAGEPTHWQPIPPPPEDA